MEVDPDALRAAARRRDALADDLAGARSLVRGAPAGGLGEAAGEAEVLLDAVEDAVARLQRDADDLVDGLRVTSALAGDTDDGVAVAFERIDPRVAR